MRWNSTYIMLERVAEFEKVFSCLQLYDSSYPYALSVNEWKNIKLVIECLNIYIIHVSLKQWSVHDESFISLMASRMLLKFDKYWRKTNTLLAIATILDPQFKMFMVRYFFEKIYGDQAEEKIEEVKIGLQRFYDTYVTRRSDHSFESRSLNISSMASISKRRVGSSSRNTLTSMHMEFGQYLQQSSLLSS
ncbi:hypothetical protein Taro_044961 [Colocasia esculenta]|uniref:hAT-like transposase RNase-H fold domain-containing protein n=1 Tax=Colocasia esculenta TaxID=4460 RepID=A0A843X608_COLES|nr:hypothetical protein [Colocasia esculenta]